FVAILGIASALLTLILERSRELAILRMVGADQGQIRRMVVAEPLVSRGFGSRRRQPDDLLGCRTGAVYGIDLCDQRSKFRVDDTVPLACGVLTAGVTSRARRGWTGRSVPSPAGSQNACSG